MALASYTDLQAAIGTWNFNRTSLPVTDFITLAESRLKRDVSANEGETEATLTPVVSSRKITLPTGFTEAIAVYIDYGSGRQALVCVNPDMETSDTNGPPTFWAVDGPDIAFDRPFDQVYTLTLRYVGTWALSDSAPTNWLLTTYPDIYLAACNVEAALWLEEYDQAMRWQARYADALSSINGKEARAKGPIRMRVDVALQPSAMGRGGGFDINRGY